MGTSHQGCNTSFPKFPIQASLQTMDIWLGGELAKEVTFILCFVSILSKPILLSLMNFYLVSFCIVVVLFVKLLVCF